jgi:formylglycine-generating enzyme required for sulfatase activity
MKYSTPRANLIVITLATLLLVSISAGAAAREDPAYQRAETWAKTLMATKAAYWQGVEKGRFVPYEKGYWYASKPIKAETLADNPIPIKSVNMKSKAARAIWRRDTRMRDSEIYLVRINEKSPFAIYYYRTLTAARGGKTTLSFGSQSSFEIWVNGTSVARSDEKRMKLAPDQFQPKITLNKGENWILVKFFMPKGRPKFYIDLKDDILPDIWRRFCGDFPEASSAISSYRSQADMIRWFLDTTSPDPMARLVKGILSRRGIMGRAAEARYDDLKTPADRLGFLMEAYRSRDRMDTDRRQVGLINLKAFRLAVNDLATSHPKIFPDRQAIDKRIDDFEKALPEIQALVLKGDPQAVAASRKFLSFQRATMLRNPLFDFDELLMVRRSAASPDLGLPRNWLVNAALKREGFHNSIEKWNYRDPEAPVKTLYRPKTDVFVGDVDLHFDAGKLLFSSVGADKCWHVYEIAADGKKLRQVTPSGDADIDHFDACYLPDGRIIFANTSGFQGVPCIGGNSPCANLLIMNADGTGIRRLCFDQDQNWSPTVLPNGTVLYQRWEYTDTSHYFSRLLMSMNPDGTAQREFYGSNSYWPNAMFYARPIPGDTNKFVAIVSGHHGVARMGELILFDKSKGRHEADGVIQRIPGYRKPVEPVIKDGLVNNSWPRFLHPWPLDEKYHLVSCMPTRDAPWGLYLVDIFDNMILLREETGMALLEPVPLRKTVTPPVIPDKVQTDRKDAVVYIQNIYEGPGLRGVRRGAVKSLKVFHYEYAYRFTGGHWAIGVEGPWDARRILGTVDVETDGSAVFKVPANVPISLLPLDAEGKSLQMMRSWFTAMPGEVVSCIGCHENLNDAPPMKMTKASRRKPRALTPWNGKTRGFSFMREVQPVLDRYCVGCHDGGEKAKGRPVFSSKRGKGFPSSYLQLHPYVRRNGPEGDYHLLTPLEFHADTSELIQMLTKGHHNVKLDPVSWDRLITWIDLNCPAYGSWSERGMKKPEMVARRRELNRRYAFLDYDAEEIGAEKTKPVKFQAPKTVSQTSKPVSLKGWPLTAAQAKGLQEQSAVSGKTRWTIDLGDGVKMTLTRIPAGRYVMGDPDGCLDEKPQKIVEIKKPFWMGTTEITMAQYQRFVPAHRNGYYDMHWKDQTGPGYPVDGADLPAIRVSCEQAAAFCKWLSKKTGRKATLPTEAQWEWACRAGAGTPLSYGDLDTDFSKFANFADLQIKKLATKGINPKPIPNPTEIEDYVPKDARFDDGVLHLAKVGSYTANAWGLHDMHGNVAEWTSSDYLAKPQNPVTAKPIPRKDLKVVRGGAWGSRPKSGRSAYRWRYPEWQRVFDVGFRIVIEDE